LQRNLVTELQQQIEHLQQAQSAQGSDQPDLQQLVDQLRASNNLMKEQSSVTTNHQAEQRETIKQLRDELQQQRDKMQDVLVDKNQWVKQKNQLEEQVSFVKSNATATIERLTRYREQAQEKIEKLEQNLQDIQKDPAAKVY
jgi:chromosome segregation ATPase